MRNEYNYTKGTITNCYILSSTFLKRLDDAISNVTFFKLSLNMKTKFEDIFHQLRSGFTLRNL